jgi:hypothetical protein
VGEGCEAGGAAEASALSPSAIPLVRRKSALASQSSSAMPLVRRKPALASLSPSAKPLVRRKSAMELRMDFSEDPPLLSAKHQIRICI